MRPGCEGSTDVLSSLPLTACCIFAVMVLVAAIGQTAGRDSAEGGGDWMERACEKLLDDALSLLTDDSPDGRRYLYHDWESRAQKLSIPTVERERLSCSISVRLLALETRELAIQGDAGACLEVLTESAPVLYVSGGTCVPGEITAKVAR